jgi:hypothetical protein
MSESGLGTIIDPRGKQERRPFELAPRVTVKKLQQGRVLFYNNTKLEFCNYTAIFPRLKELFTDKEITDFIDYRETVRGKSTSELQKLAAKLSQEKPDAAIIALGDIGVTPATTILTIALERQGIPCVYITAGPGVKLARAVAFYRAGQLCMCPLEIYQGSSVEEIRKEVDRQFDSVLEMLTASGKKLESLSEVSFPLDQTPPAADGYLKVPEELAVESSEEKQREPGSYMEEFMEMAEHYHIGDGLPMVPVTKRRLKRMLEYCPFDPDQILAREIGPSGKDILVRHVAIAAVMAGCRPQHMPILITAMRAMANTRYNFLQSVTTSHPGGNLVLVSGPIAQEVGVHGGQGCLGPGFPANATIGRAVNLLILDVTRAVPGYCDLDCIASQAEFTYCFGEDSELSPWKTINEERFDKGTSCVYVLKAEPPHDIIDFLSQTGGDLLDTYVDSSTTLGSNNCYIPGNLMFVITPDHAWLLDRDGYDKNAIRRHIHERAHHQAPMVRDRGLRPVRPAGFDEMHPIPVTRSPEDIEIVVAGGRGGHSAVILPWGLHSEAIVEAISLPNGKAAKSVTEFRRTP